MSIYEWEKDMGKKGFSLMELMVVVVIISIIAAIAVPSYLGYVKRTRRADAITALQTVALTEEKAKAEMGAYQDILVLHNTFGLQPILTVGTDTFYVVSQYYRISTPAARLTTDTFVAYANPVSTQANDYIFTLDQDGTGGTAGTVGGNPTANAMLWKSLKNQ
jgi:type IV pilus assembly protein PilE